MLVLGFSDNLRGPLFFEILKSYGVSDTLGSLIFSGSSICGFFSSLLSIRLLRKISLTQLLAFSLLLMAVGLMGISQSQQFWVLILFFGCMGASMGFMGVAQNSLVALTDLKIRNRAMSGLHAMYGLASFLAPLSVGLGLLNGWTWSPFFSLTALVSFGLFLTSFFWVKSLPQIKNENVSEATQNQTPFDRKIALACGLLGFYVIAEILVGSRLSLYSIREFSISSAEASRYVTGFFLGLLLGRLMGAFFRWPGRPNQQLSASLLLTFLFTFLGLYYEPWFFALTGFSMSLFYPVCSSYLATLFPGSESTIFSYATAAQALLIVVMQMFVGWVSDVVSLKVAMHLVFLFLLVSLICLWSLQRVIKR